jgi:hypothetical protein
VRFGKEIQEVLRRGDSELIELSHLAGEGSKLENRSWLHYIWPEDLSHSRSDSNAFTTRIATGMGKGGMMNWIRLALTVFAGGHPIDVIIVELKG